MGCISDAAFNEIQGLQICITNWKVLYVLFSNTNSTIKSKIVGAIYQVSCVTKTGQYIKLVVPAYNALDLHIFDSAFDQISSFVPKQLISPFLLTADTSYKLDNIYCISYCMLMETLFVNSKEESEFLWDSMPPLFRYGVKALLYKHSYINSINIVSHFVWTKEGSHADLPIIDLKDASAHIVFPSCDKRSDYNMPASEILLKVYLILAEDEKKEQKQNYRFKNNKKISPMGEALFTLLSSEGCNICIENFTVHNCSTNLSTNLKMSCNHKHVVHVDVEEKNSSAFSEKQAVAINRFNAGSYITAPQDNYYLGILIDYIGKNHNIFSHNADLIEETGLFRLSDQLDNFVGGAFCAHAILNEILDIPFSERHVSLKSHACPDNLSNCSLSLQHLPTMLCFKTGQLYNSPIPLFYSKTSMGVLNGLRGFNVQVPSNLFFKYIFTACLRYFFRSNQYKSSPVLDRPSSYPECLNPSTFQSFPLHNHKKMIQITKGNIKNGLSKAWPGLYMAEGRILEVDINNCYANLIKNRSRICGMLVDYFMRQRQNAQTELEATVYKRFLCELYGNMKYIYPSLYEEVTCVAVHISLKMASFVLMQGQDLIRIVRDGMMFVILPGKEFVVSDLVSYIGEKNITFSTENPADIAIIGNLNVLAVYRSNKVFSKGISSISHSLSVSSMINYVLESLIRKYISSSTFKRFSYESFLIQLCIFTSDHLKSLLKDKTKNLDIFLHPFNGRLIQSFSQWIHFRDYPIHKLTANYIPSFFCGRQFISVKSDYKLSTEEYAANWAYSLECKGNTRIIDICSEHKNSIWSGTDNLKVFKTKLVSINCLLDGYEIDHSSYFHSAMLAVKPLFISFGTYLTSYDPRLVDGVHNLSTKFMEIVDNVSKSKFDKISDGPRSVAKKMRERCEMECLEIFNAQTRNLLSSSSIKKGNS